MADKYVRVMQNIYEDSVTAVRCAVGSNGALRIDSEQYRVYNGDGQTD